MGEIKGPSKAGELGTDSVMNLPVVQVVDDATDLETGSLGDPPDALVGGVLVQDDRNGMVAIVRSTGDVYQRIGGTWTLVKSAPRYDGTLIVDDPSDFNLTGSTANTPIYFPLSSFGPFKFAGNIKITNTTPGVYYLNVERSSLVKIIYKVTDSPTPDDDVTMTAAANGYTSIDVPVSSFGNPAVFTLGTFNINNDVLVGQYIHIGFYAFNDTGADDTIWNAARWYLSIWTFSR